MTKAGALVAVAAAVAAILWVARPFTDAPAAPGSIVHAAAHSAAMSLESEPAVLRFGTPEADVREVHGFERMRLDPATEPSVGIRRRAELWLRWPERAPRSAVLDLEVPPRSQYRALRVLLNARRVARLELGPGRRRYAFDLPPERQNEGGNLLSFIFGAEAEEPPAPDSPAERVAARVYGLAVGRPSSVMTAIALAPLPFSSWAEGDDLVQAGPSRLAWAVRAPAAAQLRFETSARHGAPSFRIEAEGEGGARTEVWRGGAGQEAAVDLPAGEGDVIRLWLHVENADGAPAWGTWKGLGLTGRDPPPPAASPPTVVDGSRAGFASANVLVLVLDAAGARHFGCYGHTRATTPNIDRIAAEGIVFERAYTPAVFTRSAMASVWTSQLPDEHHASVPYDEPLPAAVPTLAGIVSAHGIPTAGFVGNNMAGTAFGLDRGFQEFYRLSYRAAILREYLDSWLSRNGSRRFLAYVHYREPHYPFDPRPPFNTMFGPDAPLPASAKTGSEWMDRVNEGTHRPTPEEIDHLERLYNGNLALVDEEVGLLRAHLERLGAWDRTVVIITADHGEAMYEHGFIGHNEQLFEDSVRIPLILRFPPGTIPGGRRVEALTGLLDLAPTVADILGVPKERLSSFRGRSLLPDAAGGASIPPDEVLSRTVGGRPRYTHVGARYKYHYNTRDGDEQLYDLARDPGERTDISDTEPVQAEYRRQRLFAALLALPGRSGASPLGWSVPADQVESLRALGYVQ